MYYLVENHWLPTIASSGLEIVQQYPTSVLVKGDSIPVDISPANFEILNDPVIRVNGVPVAIPEGEFRIDEEPHTLVRFCGPLSPDWHASLLEAGVTVLSWCPRFGACVSLPENMDAATLQARCPFIIGAQPYREEHSSRWLASQSAGLTQRTGLPKDLVDLVCFSRDDRQHVEKKLHEMGIEILDTSSSKIRIHFTGDLQQLRSLTGVKLVDLARGPVLAGLSPASALPAIGLITAEGKSIPYRGRGQIVAVADTGLDCGLADSHIHPDFVGRVRSINNWPINPTWSAFLKQPASGDDAADRSSGHGTHVAGLAVGSGAAGSGMHPGMAPEAELVFQAIEHYVNIKSEYQTQIPSGYYLCGRPLNLRELFQQAYDLGARIQVNAWGDPSQGQYTDDCYEADMFLYEHPESVILFAAGNDGYDRDGDGLLDASSLYAPGTAKNVVTIGATEGPGMYLGWQTTWGAIDPEGKRFRNPSERAAPLSGQPERMALFSSTGPTADGRVKPDICAPGTNLVGPRSNFISGRGWGLASPLPYYMYYGGTSIATGVAGGWFAVLRQAWQEYLHEQAPSGVALKALAILAARPIRQHCLDAEEPSISGGYGRIDLQAALPGPQVKLLDGPELQLVSGDRREYTLHCDQPGSLKAVLTWYDAPGEVLVNDLDLVLKDSSGNRTWGNHLLNEGNCADRCNTVEVIQSQLIPGDYILSVIGANVMTGSQSFALAVRLPSGCQLLETSTESAAPFSALDLPVTAIRGIGPRMAARLQAQGINTVGPLISMTREALGIATQLKGGKLSQLFDHLQLLQAALLPINQFNSPVRALPGTLALSGIFLPGAPVGIAFDVWQQAQTMLKPLMAVFDKSCLKTIRICQLYT